MSGNTGVEFPIFRDNQMKNKWDNGIIKEGKIGDIIGSICDSEEDLKLGWLIVNIRRMMI